MTVKSFLNAERRRRMSIKWYNIEIIDLLVMSAVCFIGAVWKSILLVINILSYPIKKIFKKKEVET